MSDSFFVLTGGPGSGKSTMIAELGRAGYRSMPEAGRAIIRDQMAIGGTALPWADRAAFADLMLGWELRSHAEAGGGAGPVLFDRGLPDVIGYRRLCGLEVPDALHRAAELHRYNRQIFLAPHWPEIFTQDAERRQDEEEARRTCEMMAHTYAALDYEVLLLPLASVAARADFIRDRIGPPR